MLYQDSVSVLLVRKNTALPVPLRDTSESAFKQLAQGLQALVQGDLIEARTYLERSRQLMPWAGAVYSWLAILSAEEGDVERGWRYIQEAENIFPTETYRDAYNIHLKNADR